MLYQLPCEEGLTPEEATILTKNNRAKKKGESSDNKNEVVSYLEVPTRILAKENTNSEEDAREKAKEWIVTKRGSTRKVKNMHQ